MSAVQPALTDCDPDRTDEPGDHQPTRFDCRQHEMRDLRGQAAGPHALWTAHTVAIEERYL
ncbi:hypothetical protein [Streptomyces scabiei]|uniref:hypothetical protein n=1 Tax=Streptomyces scabiei TaxID=1930 RepID=UPI001B30A06D|nr:MULTISPECIES: hypothetical protein [Streptomyces]MBP5870880.1 hypothetical protein [Streptomyces sp. LBUM 1485]MBP5913215.1 hypothetical protein [Streptomyces sp. LBUM 1486]MDX2794623.1 hypothetical protein [Streptomyces scabiei]MDX3822375.1 hypothetical protein [Streptomyces scabiei]QTU57368.1 hypothetical protein F3K21_35085 [Streptomyces sp. LBUM 1480]